MAQEPWKEHYPPNVAWDAEILTSAVHSVLDEAVKKYGGKTALDFLGKKITYRELGEMVDKAARGFQELGVTKGTHVGIYLPNCPFFLVAWFGILKAGGTVVNCSALYSAEELAHQAKDSEMKMIVTTNLEQLYPKAAALLEHGTVGRAVVFPFEDALPGLKPHAVRLINKAAPLLEALAGAAEKLPPLAGVAKKLRHIANAVPRLCAIPQDGQHILGTTLLENAGNPAPVTIYPAKDIAVLQYTGGTTGTPKGAMLTHANLTSNLQQIKYWFDGTVKDGEEKMVGLLPLFHIFALTVIGMYGMQKGMEIILYPKKPNMGDLIKDIEEKGATILPGVPALFNALRKHPAISRERLASLTFCVSGGDSLPVEVLQDFQEKTGARLVEGYGLSETSPVACAQHPDAPSREGSTGQPLPGTTITIVDSETPTLVLEIGATGEICIQGPQVMKGYYNKPAETIAVSSAHGFHTGDVGYLDTEGYLHITGRKKDVIIINGFKVYPAQVERVIYQHPAVAEAVAIGVDDPASGQRVKVFIQLKEGVEVTKDDLIAHMRAGLNKVAVPKEKDIVFSSEPLPKTTIGKIDRKALVERERQERELG